MAQARILVVDDEPDIRELIQEILADEGYEVNLAEDAASARERRRQNAPDLILLDIWMPDTDGISLLREWHEAGALDCPVVMISGHGSIETAVEATRLGAWDFIEKPIALAKLLVTVQNALEAQRLQSENRNLQAQRPEASPGVIGRSVKARELQRQIERLANYDAHALLVGEPGTGKESLAGLIHARSARAGEPLVHLNVLSMDQPRRALLGGEQQPGLLMQAARGTLYIDNLATLDPEAQRLLLSAMESDQIPTASGPQPFSARVLAACEQPPEALIRSGALVEGLYLRLNGAMLEIPPLRERLEDVPDLVRYYEEYFPDHDKLPYRRFSTGAQNRLRNHSWPGNVRELRNLVQRLLLLGGEGEVSREEVENALRHSGDRDTARLQGASPAIFDQPLREAREQFEREYLAFHLQQAGGSVGQLAEIVGMERTHLYRKLRGLGIDPREAAQADRQS